MIYLTIDDSPSKDFRVKTNYLYERNIPAIVFCVGEYLEMYQDDVIEAIQKGLIIGNHSYGHPQFSKISTKQGHDEIKKADEIIEELYRKSGTQRPGKVFRFPFSNKGSRFILNRLGLSRKYFFFQNCLRQMGYRQPHFEGINYRYFNKYRLNRDIDTFWTFNLREYRAKTIEEVFGWLEQENQPVGGDLNDCNSRDIMLIHDHDKTTHMFMAIIDKLIDKKIEFVLPRLVQGD